MAIARRRVLFSLGASLVAFYRVPLAQENPGPSLLAGTWSGVLEGGPQGMRLRLELEIEANGDAKLRSVDQSPTPLAAKATSMTRELVVIELAALHVRFTGKLVASDRIEGTWTQGVEMPLALLRGEAGLSAPPMQAPALTRPRIEAVRQEGGMPALAAAVVRKGRAPQSWVTGERMLGSAVAATTHDQWHLGSITKSMTATHSSRDLPKAAR